MYVMVLVPNTSKYYAHHHQNIVVVFFNMLKKNMDMVQQTNSLTHCDAIAN